jgi:hypothetical protein
MEQAGRRGNSTLLVGLAAGLLLPAVVILAVAYASGYLDTLYASSLYTNR